MKALERWAIDSFFGGAVLKDVVRACVSGDTIDRIREFLDEHAAVFEGAVSGSTSWSTPSCTNNTAS